MIYFVGAGSGDPELITFKGYKLLRRADLVIYTGSLINPELLEYTREGSELINSAGLDLEEIMDLMITAHERGKLVVRLHTGDPSIYGAVGEQMKWLQEQGIEFEVVPGVSSFLAAAASLKKEYTVPGQTQTVIITRMEGKTPVPETEKLKDLAGHRASMAIFLSVGMIEKVVEELLEGYPENTPCTVIEKASWPEERIIEGELSNISDLVKKAGIKKTALILVGDFLTASGKSKLYDKEFSHGYRGKG